MSALFRILCVGLLALALIVSPSIPGTSGSQDAGLREWLSGAEGTKLDFMGTGEDG